ncbi:unnamed protein product [Anisakis simplex]|uniref:G_PROTEIN_RECEP_F1_2 domain-containing protein n=1 Tax=Anisakis simplex TaxID=6269 RepID=A0A0M3K039_ANISI|nr:unnamed protein product [Anisakis simplex]
MSDYLGDENEDIIVELVKAATTTTIASSLPLSTPPSSAHLITNSDSLASHILETVSSSSASLSTVTGLIIDSDLSLGSILLAIIMGALSIITVVGNLAVLFSYYIDKNIRQPSNYFIFSLAVSDLMFCIVIDPI